MKSIYLLAFVFTSNLVMGQQLYDLPTDYLRNQVFYLNSVVSKGQLFKGSPYLNDTFEPGRLSTPNKEYPVMLRYNAYTDVFEIQTGKEQNSEVAKTEQIKVKIKANEFELKSLPEGETVYLQKLIEGAKVNLWLHNKVKFKEAVKAKTAYSQDKPAEFILMQNYYIDTGKGLEPFKLRKKELISLFKASDGPMNTYVKQQNLSYTKEEDVVKMITYFNSL